MLRARKFKDLEKRLGYKFRNEELLARALTHASVRGGGKKRADNERLEFLGDRVLGLAIVEAAQRGLSRSQRRRTGAALQPPRQRRHLRQGRPRIRHRRVSHPLRQRSEQRRPQQGYDPSRRDRGDPRRGVPRPRLRQGQGRRASALGQPARQSSQGCRRSQVRAPGMGAGPGTIACRNTSRSSARDRTTRRSSSPK